MDADDREQQRVEHEHEVEEEQERHELHAGERAGRGVHEPHDRREIDGEGELEAQRGTAVGARERVAARTSRDRGHGGEVGEDGEHQYFSWWLTWSFMVLKTFAAGSLPLRNVSSVGWTIRLICGALSVIG